MYRRKKPTRRDIVFRGFSQRSLYVVGNRLNNSVCYSHEHETIMTTNIRPKKRGNER